MGVIITPQSEIEAYFASSDLGQSTLKKLLKGIDGIFEEQQDLSDKPYMIIGKAVDTILTGEEGEFHKKYYVSSVTKKPTEAVANIIDTLYQQLNNVFSMQVTGATTEGVQESPEFVVAQNDSLVEESSQSTFLSFAGTLEDRQDLVLQIANQLGYQSRWGDEAKLKNLITDETKMYFLDLCKAYGKTVIDQTTNLTIQNIVMSLTTNNRTAKYFNRGEQARLVDVDFIYQLPIYFEFMGVNCKALLDLVIVVRNEQGQITSIEPIDLKTMNGNTYNFLGNVKSFRYDIQGAWYTTALMSYYAVSRSIIEPFKFIVESSTQPGKPLVFEMTPGLLEIGLKGRSPLVHIESLFQADNTENLSKQYTILKEIDGIEQLMNKYIYHSENGWDREREVIEADNSNTPLLLTWDFITNKF